jgi:hypothetical protein
VDVRGPSDVQPDEPGWWLASDGKWYPPESAPSATGWATPATVGTASAAWWDSTWFFVVTIFVCFPVMLVLLWRKPWHKGVKIGVTALVAVFVVASIASGPKSEPKRDASSESAGADFTPLVDCGDGTQASDLGSCPDPSSTTSTTTTTPPPTAPPTTSPPPPTTAPAPVETAGQSNARRSAFQYLNLGKGFSRTGLIEQLSSQYGEGFSLADATYGVDATHTDWNAQACISAKTYLELQAFSHSGLVEQLSSQYGEQFTVAQAEYGVSCAGL